MARYLREADLGGIEQAFLTKGERNESNRFDSPYLDLQGCGYDSGKLNLRVLTCQNPKGSRHQTKFGGNLLGFDGKCFWRL